MKNFSDWVNPTRIPKKNSTDPDRGHGVSLGRINNMDSRFAKFGEVSVI